jgi:hypothetical protein
MAELGQINRGSSVHGAGHTAAHVKVVGATAPQLITTIREQAL